MRVSKLLLLAFIVFFFSTCKKDKEETKTSYYPAIYEFKTDGAEITTHGVVNFPSSSKELIIQNARYYPSVALTRTVHSILDLENLTGGEIIKRTWFVSSKPGKYQVNGNVTLDPKNIGNIYGASFFSNSANNTAVASYYKFDRFGNIVLPLREYTINEFELNRIVEVDDGFLVVGAKVNGTDKNVIVMKYNKTLSVKIWEKEFGGAGNDAAMDAVQLCDNNYGILAYTYSKGAGDRDVWFLKLDANGFLKWDSTYGGAAYEEPQRIVSRTGCDIYILGHSSSFGAPEHDGYVLRINENGIIVWEKTFGTQHHDGLQAAVNIPNTKNFVAVGRSMQGTGQPEDVFVVCFDEKGNELWRKKYGDPNLTELPQDIVADNEFYYLACNRVDANGKYTAVFIKDKLGN
jgi:hypothetical protein